MRHHGDGPRPLRDPRVQVRARGHGRQAATGRPAESAANAGSSTDPLPAATPTTITIGTRTAAEAAALVAAVPQPDVDWHSPSPPGHLRRGSAAWWEAKSKANSAKGRLLMAELERVKSMPVTVGSIHPAFQVQQASPPREGEERKRQRAKGAVG